MAICGDTDTLLLGLVNKISTNKMIFTVTKSPLNLVDIFKNRG